jgi:hypothetical protein
LSSGLNAPSSKHGVDIKRAFSPAEYLTKFGYDTKWGTASELLKANSKIGSNSLTSFDFLRSDRHDLTKPLFIEFARCFFGKRQLVYSKGLKNLLAIADVQDSDIASGDLQPSTLCMSLDSAQWSKIVRSESTHCSRATVLKLSETGGQLAVIRYLESLD